MFKVLHVELRVEHQPHWLNKQRGKWLPLVTIIVVLAAFVLTGSLLSIMVPASISYPHQVAISQLTATIFAASLLVYLSRQWFGEQASQHFFKSRIKPSWRQIMLVLLTSVFLSLISLSYSHYFGLTHTEHAWASKLFSPSISPSIILLLVIVSPIFEEVLFRGWLFQAWLDNGVPPIVCIIMTSALWSFVHIQYSYLYVFLLFIFACLLAIIRLKTKSYIITIYIHGLYNLIQLTLLIAYFK